MTIDVAVTVDEVGPESSALFSEDRVYRYLLWRVWGEGPKLNFLMLNPSTADEVVNDPTVERCERRARAMGYGGLYVTNLFALRSTDPAALYGHADPVGPLNDAAIVAAAQSSKAVVCAWGTHGALNQRGRAVEALLRQHGVVPCVLELTKEGHPKHPLYVAYSRLPQLWTLENQ